MPVHSEGKGSKVYGFVICSSFLVGAYQKLQVHSFPTARLCTVPHFTPLIDGSPHITASICIIQTTTFHRVELKQLTIFIKLTGERRQTTLFRGRER
jgi:hypothetical protein